MTAGCLPLCLTSRIRWRSGPRQGRDTYALFRYDTEQRKIGELMAGHPSQDILSTGGIDPSAFERVTTRGMRTEDFWFDPVWGGVKDVVDRALPGRINRLSGNPRGMVMVYSYSDIEPGEWHLLDTTKGSLLRLTRRRPLLGEVAMRPMEIMQYQAADGLTVPAFLTRPADGAQGVPLVVLIHGGPARARLLELEPGGASAGGAGLCRVPAAVPRLQRFLASVSSRLAMDSGACPCRMILRLVCSN